MEKNKSNFFKQSMKSSLLLLSMALLAACGSEEGSGADGQGNDGGKSELVYASTADAPGLSPIDTNDSISANVAVQIFETLFAQNPDTGEIEPYLAESYENPDDNTWIIKLKEDINFHDGTPFNAEAVKYTFDTLKDPERAAPRASIIAPITSIEVEDEYTVILHTEKPYGPMLAALSHYNTGIVSPTADQEGDINRNPVGTGPFVFEEWVEGDHISMVRNEDYWQEPAELEKFTIKIVPEYSTAISMLETGEVDFLDVVPSDHISRLEGLEGVNLDIIDGTRVSYLGFNMEKSPYNEQEFRDAIAHAIDQETYVSQLNGLGVFNESYIGPNLFGYDETSQDFAVDYNPDKAAEIIEANGYGETPITMLVANRENYLKMGEIVQQQLTDVGLNVSMETIEWAAFLDATAAGDFEMTFNGWSNSTGDGSELLYPNLHSDNIGSGNRVRYNNPEFDQLVEESRETVDQEERKEKLRQANELVMQELPWVIMEHGSVTAAYRDNVNGLVMDPQGQFYVYGVSME